MKILWSQSALADLEAIHAYIARDSKVYADAVVFDIFTAIDRLEKFPK